MRAPPPTDTSHNRTRWPERSGKRRGKPAAARERDKEQTQALFALCARLLGEPVFGSRDAAEILGGNPRTWERFASGQKGVHEGASRMLILACFLEGMEIAEEANQLEQFLGGPFSVRRMRDRLHDLWAKVGVALVDEEDEEEEEGRK
jgi:hypothetical protein